MKRITRKAVGVVAILLVLCCTCPQVNVLADSTREYLLQIPNEDDNYVGTTQFCKDNLTEENWRLLNFTVMGEAGDQGFIGACLVAQSIRDHLVNDETSNVAKVLEAHGYKGRSKKIPENESVRNAIDYIFNQGGNAVKHRVLRFYAPALCSSEWHEKQDYLVTYKDHKFFDDKNTSVTPNANRDGTYVVLKDTYSDAVACGTTSTIEEALEQIATGTLSYGNYTNNLTDFKIPEQSMEGLTTAEREVIAEFQEDLNRGGTEWVSRIRAFVSLFFILIIVYGLGLILVYILERYNILVDCDLVRLYTFGFYYYVETGEDMVKDGRARPLDLKNVLLLAIGIVLLGFIGVSGKFYSLIKFILRRVKFK